MATKQAQSTIKRVGFDLDGVVLYNPMRIFRPFISLAKKNDKDEHVVRFYVPQKKLMKVIWKLIHKSSLFVAPGFYDTIKLLKDNNIEAYLITGRFGTLKEDFDKWMKKVDAKNNFKAFYHNPKDEQPHLFKKRMIDELKLDVFIDDNWDIVHYLSSEFKNTNKKILWITNIFDRKKRYDLKFSGMNKVYHYFKKDLF
ncbi:MAG: hypothetical protein ABIO02_02400 [Patescibacteria group bacterium]